MRNLNARTHAGYEELPSALHLSTVSLVHSVVTGTFHPQTNLSLVTPKIF